MCVAYPRKAASYHCESLLLLPSLASPQMRLLLAELPAQSKHARLPHHPSRPVIKPSLLQLHFIPRNATQIPHFSTLDYRPLPTSTCMTCATP